MTVFMSWISKSAIPALIIIILLSGIIKKVPVFDTFLEGAREGLETTVRILPVLVGIMLGIEILSSSGALDMIVHLLKPLAAFLKIPEEILPMAIIRPISGSASLGLLKKQLEEYGPDSLIGRTLSVIMGSTETIFYTITVYYGAIGVKKTRYTLWVSLIAAFAGLISAVVVCRILQ
ncbi:spore maturation protein [Thermoclostridium stercorarium subsp. thermolacticum DSM 2910]|jgi:spore maturation protein B|uniref:Spore maturation protein n=2 Tax=Thermoclostridium stercorarium TaxID=1510 RepID=A0A1B1YJV7_THEST|nr:nucleoside recognition domain-containing protein [Thermoclostridium stercorarium]ANW98534.1 spore maturation protein [Thermoclostridium stercorarium subsp. thermolacticum DSM 2910]ANX01069.1 spore maturation protein [Thermoclostridium stercorarium subsp. leptospartum DSM 9219]UZQ86687.1 spore maturation protein [Thermoclostridium stercorarium]